jgi:acetyl-CoA carboxylase biotin carboxylase subunit
VTEERVGRDLVGEQLRVALGERLSLPPETEWSRLHAMEFRINAEDPGADFMPSPGTVRCWQPPAGEGIRFDSFVREGMQIQPFYDSMVGKLIVSGDNRESAMERGRFALQRFHIEGIATTAPFHLALLGDTDFRSNRIHTRWVEQSFMPAWAEESGHG